MELKSRKYLSAGSRLHTPSLGNEYYFMYLKKITLVEDLSIQQS